MKFEFSAGGLVFKREGGPIRQAQGKSAKREVKILVSQHSGHHGWVFPKGKIGDNIKGETKEETAIREVKEETGILAKIIKPLNPVEYWYQQDGEKIKKTVCYFLMEFVEGDIKDHDWEMENVEWLSPKEVENRLTYPSDKKVWKEAESLIDKLTGND